MRENEILRANCLVVYRAVAHLRWNIGWHTPFQAEADKNKVCVKTNDGSMLA